LPFEPIPNSGSKAAPARVILVGDGMTIPRGIEVDRSRFPLVVLRHGRRYTDADFHAVTVHLNELLRRGPFGLITDTRGSPMPSPLQRRTIIQFYADHDREIRANLLATAVVGDSTLVRGVLTALQWIRPAPHPVQIFASMVDAEAWVTSHFSEELARLARARSVAGDPTT
jgi:hypothetical protein